MTSTVQDRLDLIENPESRVACVIVVDVSGSMGGKPIDEVNRGLITFGAQIEEDELTSLRSDIAVIAFNHDHKIVRTFGQHVDFSQAALQAYGGTRMAPPVHTALDIIEQRKEQYRDAGITYYRPVVMLITDGKPEHDSAQEMTDLATRIKAAEKSRSISFFPIGTESADMDELAKLSNRPPKTLRGANFVELFQWLSNSIAAISQAKIDDPVDLPTTEDWSVY